MNRFEQCRQYYPVLAASTFLNTSQSGLIPTYAGDAMCADIQYRVNYAYDIVMTNNRWAEADVLREKIARLLRCGPEEIVIGANSSSLFNIFSNGIDLQPGDNVITYDAAYFAMTFTWINQEQNGVEMRLAKAKDGRIDAEDLFALVDERTRAISVCHVDFGSGFRHDLAALGTFCRERGIYLAVDATQSCGVLDIDVKQMKIDFLTTSCYKWLQCVWGIGFAYIDEALIPQLKQVDIGWTGARDKMKINPLVLDLSDNANRFECGGLNFTAMSGLMRTIDAYLVLGARNIEEYVLSLTDYAYSRAKRLKQVKVLGEFEPKHRSNIVTFTFPPAWPISREYLLARNIEAMVMGAGRCRIGIHYYNNQSDIDRFFDCLAELDG